MKKQFTILFLIIVLFSFKSISFAQQRDSLIQLYPTLGDTINRFEKEFYGLFSAYPGFEQATFYIRDNKYLVTRITYITVNGIEKDTTQVQPLSYLGNIRTYLHTVNEEKKDELNSGKLVTVTTIDEKTLTAKVAMIDNDKMILYAPTINPLESGYEPRSDLVTLPKNQIKSVFIPGESNIGTAILWGGVAGVTIGVALGFLAGDDPPNKESYNSHNQWADLFFRFRTTAGQKALAGGILFGLTGAAIGLFLGLITSTDDQLIEINSDADYDKLKHKLKDVYMFNPYQHKFSYQLK